MVQTDFTVVVPAFNEAESLRSLLPELLQAADKWDWKVVVVNDGSTDDSQDVLDSFRNHSRLTVLRHKVNRGYGAAIKTGMSATASNIVGTMDADGQHNLQDVRRAVEHLLSRGADLVIGNRCSSPGSGRFRSLGKWCLRRLAALMVPLHIHDLNSGLKVYDGELARRYAQLCPNTMAFSDAMPLLFISRKHLVVELPISVTERLSGQSKVNMQAALDTVIGILDIVMLVNPLKIFLPLSLLFGAAGFAWGTPFVLMGRGVSVGALLAILAALTFFLMGLLAGQLSLLRLAASDNGANDSTRSLDDESDRGFTVRFPDNTTSGRRPIETQPQIAAKKAA